MPFTFLILRMYQLATSNTQSKSQISSDIQHVFWFEISAYDFSLYGLNFKYGVRIGPVFHTVCVLLPLLGSANPFH